MSGRLLSQEGGEEGEVHVVMAGDLAVAPGLAVAMSSLLNATQYPERIFMHVLTTPNDVDKVGAVLRCVTRRRHPSSKIEVRAFNSSDYDTLRIVSGSSILGIMPARLTAELNFARFFLPQVFQSIRDKVVYLDADLVIDGDVVELYDSALSISDLPVAAVPRGAQRLRLAPSVSRNRAALDVLRSRGLDLQPGTTRSRQRFYSSVSNISASKSNIDNKDHSLMSASRSLPFAYYSKNTIKSVVSIKKGSSNKKRLVTQLQDFNAGVLVIHLERWRQLQLTTQVLEWMQLNAKYELYTRGSNPPLVLALADRFERLDGRWNCPARPSSTPLSPRCRSVPGVLHLTGPNKPWHLTPDSIDPRWRAKLTTSLTKCLKLHLDFSAPFSHSADDDDNLKIPDLANKRRRGSAILESPPVDISADVPRSHIIESTTPSDIQRIPSSFFIALIFFLLSGIITALNFYRRREHKKKFSPRTSLLLPCSPSATR